MVLGQPTPPKKIKARLYIKNKLGVEVHICNPSYVGSIGRRIKVYNQLRQKAQKPI
jgi:hypothetical protein